MNNYSPALQKVFSMQVRVTPQYRPALEARLQNLTPNDALMVEHIADQIIKLTGDSLDQFCADYKWICDVVLEEEMHFRRHGSYRLKTFAEANAEIYSVPEKMTPYMNGLLMTQLWWPNHTASIAFLKNKFLKNCDDNYSVLEVGPGHGLLLSYPAFDDRCKSVEAWDLSDASLVATRLSLDNIGVTREVSLLNQDLFLANPENGTFDAIIFSEVLEHLEYPKLALEKLRNVLNPNGSIYIHIPINSPAPDHIFNLDKTSDVVEFIEQAGFKVIDSEFAPMSGYTLEQCEKKKLTISCLINAQKV